MRPVGVSAQLVSAGLIPNASSGTISCMRLDAVPPAPGLARKFVEAQLAAATVAQREAAVLLASELVTNAVLGARSSLEVGVGVVEGRVIVAVNDPKRRAPDEGTIEGRSARSTGRVLISALADQHGAVQHECGRTVWAVLNEHGRAACAGAVSESAGRRR